MPAAGDGRAALDPRTPVLVGVGTASGDAQAVELMADALARAADDAGSSRLLERADRIAVPQGSWSYPDPGRLVADAVGARRARTHLVELGIPQQALINEALAQPGPLTPDQSDEAPAPVVEAAGFDASDVKADSSDDEEGEG